MVRGIKKVETLIKLPVTGLGLGHMTLLDPNRYLPGQSHRTYDVNLDLPSSVRKRTGIRFLCENPIGAVQIATCEEAGWDGNSTADAVNFRKYEVGGAGAASRKLTIAGPATISSVLTLAAPLDLGADVDEYIAFWLSTVTPALVTSVSVDFASDAGFVNRLEMPAQIVSATAGFNLYVVKKRDFTVVAAGTWSNIGFVRLKLIGTAATSVSFDNIYLAPRKTDGLYNFRQSPKRGGGNFKVGAARGAVAYLDEVQRRWVPIKTGLTAYVPYSFQTFTDFLYWANGYDSVMVALGDGFGNLTPATTFTAGITAPAATATFVVVAGGVLAAGIHDYRFEFFSDLTGLPGDTTALHIPATAAASKIQLANLPVSVDPKVAKLRIYRKDATDVHFFRVADLANGTLVYEDNTADLSLGAELAGFPSYLIRTPPPKLAYLAVVGGKMVGAGERANPGVSYVSQANNAEQWDLAKGPTRHDLDDNDVITSVFDAWGFSAIGKTRGVYIGTAVAGPSGFSYVKRIEDSGPVSHRGIVKGREAIHYRSHDGFYQMDRAWRAQKVTRGWDAGVLAPGLIEPTFSMLDGRDTQGICGAYLKGRGQILWNDKMFRDAAPNLICVYHLGQLEGLPEDAGGSVGGWSFHRYAKGDALEGISAMDEYVDQFTGKILVMAGGTGGFVYEVDSGEYDDILPPTRLPSMPTCFSPSGGSQASLSVSTSSRTSCTTTWSSCRWATGR